MNDIKNTPLADRMRPRTFDDMAGQHHLVGKNGVLRRLCAAGRISSMIFYGPPGTGKTTAANIIAENSGMMLRRLNATTASLSDIKDVVAQLGGIFASGGILLYLDEIQYFNKKQQQSLLEYIEDGRITLIASTTENPYYYIYDALLSRCSVFEFKPVSAKDCEPLVYRAVDALNESATEGEKKSIDPDAAAFVAGVCAGDVRRALTLLEGAYYAADSVLTKEAVSEFVPASAAGNFDRAGDVHYDLLSGLQKSIRGSDPDAALFYLAKLLEGGDLLSACRRLLVIASEDIGAAYPMAAAITFSCTEAAKQLGLPEATLPLSNAVVMLATSPKSNAAHIAYEAAAADVRAGKGLEIPEYLRSPLFKGYKYPHDFKNHYVTQRYLPYDLGDTRYYEFGENKTEDAARRYWEQVKKEAGE